MDKLPHSLLLDILSRLDDSAEAARCRVASKAFNDVFPGLRSINLKFSCRWYLRQRHQRIKPFRTGFLNLILKMKTVESVCINFDKKIFLCDPKSDVFNFTGDDFGKLSIPRVSGSLKSLSISGELARNALPLISSYCHNLVNLKLALVPVYNLSPMPNLKSLTLDFTDLDDEQLEEMNKCFPNLQVFELLGPVGLVNPKIHHYNLKTCHFMFHGGFQIETLTLITPNLITLDIECPKPADFLYLEAPMLSYFYLGFNPLKVTVKKFENLKTLRLVSSYVCPLLSEFPITKTVEDLSLHSGNFVPRDERESKLTLAKVFTVFPNVSSLYIRSGAWAELEASLNPKDWEIFDGRKGLKTICAKLVLRDPLLTYSSIALLLDQCVDLLEVQLLIHNGVTGTVSESFRSKCIARWPELKWRWGTWR